MLNPSPECLETWSVQAQWTEETIQMIKVMEELVMASQ